MLANRDNIHHIHLFGKLSNSTLDIKSHNKYSDYGKKYKNVITMRVLKVNNLCGV